MSAKSKYLTAKFLKGLEPLSKLSMDKLNELANKSIVETLPPDRILFRQGDRDARSVYVLSGQVELTVAGSKPEVLKAKTHEARYPVAQSIPRPSTGKTKSSCELLYIDTDLLEILLDIDDIPSGNYEVTEINAEDDANGWMLKFLQSRAFLSLPTENIQKLLMKMDDVSAKKGDLIIKQGQSNDFYYIVKQGKCGVSRRPTPSAEDVQVAILGLGDGFGEEALITGGKRNASVKMLEDGAMMRLKKADFIDLLVEPLLDFLDEDTLIKRASAGDMLIDVRQHKEFMEGHMDGAVNIPLSMLRLKLNGLHDDRNYLVYCDNATRSRAAAFLLIQYGLSCSILQDGYAGKSAPPTESRPQRSGTSMADIIANLESVGSSRKLASATEKAVAKSSAQSVKQKPSQANKFANKKPTAKPASKAKVGAEKKQQAVEAERSKQRAKLFQLEARQAKEKLETVNQQKAEEKEARTRAEAELKHVKKEEQKRSASLKKLADQQRQSAEQMKRESEQERQKLQTEINQAKLDAEQEIQKYREILQQQQNHQSNLEQSKQQLEIQTQQAIAEAKRHAQAEAKKIRLQADSETQLLRAELEKTKQEVTARVEALRIEEVQKETEEKRLLDEQAQKTQEEANKKEQAIIRRAEKTRKAEQAIEIKQQQANQAIRDSIEQARQQAAQEADAIRREALKEARQLRAELQAKREQVKAESERIRLDAETQRQQALDSARQHAEELINRTSAEIQRQALAEAEAIRNETLVEARRLHEELEAKRKLIELHASKENAKMMHTLEINKKQAEEIRRQAELEAERIRLQAIQDVAAQKQAQESVSDKLVNDLSGIELPGFGNGFNDEEYDNSVNEAEDAAKMLAEQIVTRLERADKIRQQDKQSNSSSNGLQVSPARVRKVRNKTIIEGDEDIFVFKEPSIDAAAILEEEEDNDKPIRHAKHKSNLELPDFIVDEPVAEKIKFESSKRDKAEFLIVDEQAKVAIDGPVSEFSDFELHDTNNYSNPFIENTRRKQKSRFFALAATLMIAVGSTGTFFYLNQSDNNQVAISDDTSKTLKATRMSGMGVDKVQLEKDLINEAEEEFSKLMKKWQNNQKDTKANKE